MEIERGVLPKDAAARGRACSAVNSLKGILEYVQRFVCTILEIKKTQAKVFNERVGQFLKLLQETSDVSQSHLRQSTREIVQLALTVTDLFGASINSDNTILSNIVDIINRRFGHFEVLKNLQIILEEVPQILQEINLIDDQMKRFLNDTDLDKVLEDLYRYIEVQPAREMVKDLIRASGKLKRYITIFHQMATEITILCEDLEFLLDFLRNPVYLCRGTKFVEYIKLEVKLIKKEVSKGCLTRNFVSAANNVGKYINPIKVFVVDLKQSQRGECIIRGIITPSEGKRIDELMKEICYSESDMDSILHKGLIRIHFIRERIELIKCKA